MKSLNLFLYFIFFIFLFSCSKPQKNITIASGGTGGVYFPLAGGIANIFSKNIEGHRGNAEVTGGSVDNIKLLSQNKVEIGFSIIDTAYDAYMGRGVFDSKIDLRILAILYLNRVHLVTDKNSGIEKFTDLENKKVSVGSPGSGTEVTSLRIINSFGLTDKYNKQRLSVVESVNALKDKKIDAFFWLGGLPTSAITDLSSSFGSSIKIINTTENIDELNDQFGNLYRNDIIPANTYNGLEGDIQTISLWNVLLVRSDMDEDFAYKLTETIFKNLPDLELVHSEAKNFNIANQISENSPIPFHPGALNYFNN